MLLTGVTPPRRSRVRAAAAVATANRLAMDSGPIGSFVLIGYNRGKRCTCLAQKLGRRLLFSHTLPNAD
jgi:hypothetical protein